MFSHHQLYYGPGYAPKREMQDSNTVSEVPYFSKILVLDIGGSFLKAGVVDRQGQFLAPAQRCATPAGATPEVMLECLAGLAAPLGDFEAVSIGFPGAIRNGIILTAPNLGTPLWAGVDFTAAAAQRFGCPVRLANDATLHGLGIIAGQGLEVVVTLGTGMGFALFCNGVPAPQIELGQHVATAAHNYDQFVGDAALKLVGEREWKTHISLAIEMIARLVNFDILYIGGGNARFFDAGDLPGNVAFACNEAGLSGGAMLWSVKL